MYNKYTQDEKRAYYARETGRLMGVLSEAYRDFYRMESLNEFLNIAEKASNQSFSNQLILWKEKISFTQFETYHGWQKIGRQPKGGSKSLMLIKGNSRDPKILYVLDIASTEGKEKTGKSHITKYKEDVLRYMGRFSLSSTAEYKEKYKGFDIMRAYKEGLGQDIEDDMLNRMENIVRNTTMTNNEFYHGHKSGQVQKEEFLNATKKISSILLASKLGEDVDSIYGKDDIKEIFRVLDNNTRLFAVWSYAKELTESFIREMEERFEKKAVDESNKIYDKAIEEKLQHEKQSLPKKEIQAGHNEKVELERDDTEKENIKEIENFIISDDTMGGQAAFNVEKITEVTKSAIDVKPIIKADNVSNYKITPDTLSETLEPGKRLVNNVEAIMMLKNIEEGERELNTEAQAVPAKYVGWGGLADVFDEAKSGHWEAVRNFLKENITQPEYEAARQSTLTGFYTPKAVIDGMYSILSDIGFKKGNVLEPSMGIGNFMGNLPDEIQGVKFYGVEQDSISGRIAKLLYPASNIQIKGFEETTFSNNFFDASIGNVPFGDFKLNDKDYDRNNFLIHDYFFAKSIDKVRNGGIIAFITSSGTMDKKDESVRKYIAARAEFLGAIRLPNNTFKGMAGTKVTSDIIFFKKRDSVMERDEDWIHLSSDDKGLTYNKYFVDNPEMVIGTMEEVSGRFGSTLTCSPILFSVPEEMRGKSIGERIKIIGKKIAEKAEYEEAEVLTEAKEAIPATDDVRNFSYTVIDGEVYYRENSLFMKNWMWKAVTETDDKGKEHTIHIRREPVKSEKEKVIAYIGVRNALDDVIKSRKENVSDEAVKAAQDRLNEVYDTFSKKYGFINGQGNTRLFRQDAAFPLVSSAEVLDEDRKFVSKGDIFTKRTIAVAKPIEHVDTSPEALVLSISQKGKIDFSYMERLTGKDRKTLIEELKGEIFLNLTDMQKRYEPVSFIPENGNLPFINAAVTDTPKYEYVTKDEYLSGNIREKNSIVDSYISKLKYAERMSAGRITEQEKKALNSEIALLEYQKSELMKAMPKELTASEINVKLGTAWILAEDINDFVVKTLKPSAWVQLDIKVRFSVETGAWNIEGKSADYKLQH